LGEWCSFCDIWLFWHDVWYHYRLYLTHIKSIRFSVYCGLFCMICLWTTYKYILLKEQKCCQLQNPAKGRVFMTFCCQMSSCSSWLLWPSETTKVSRKRNKKALWYCGYFCKLPGVPVWPRNGWGLNNVVGAVLFMQSIGSLFGDREYSENSLALFYLKIFWPMAPLKNDLKNCNLDSNIQLK